jgi:hypothetical protein
VKQERDFSRRAAAFSEGIAMNYRVLQEQDRRYPIRVMCRALATLSPGCYGWRARLESARAAANQALLTRLNQLHRESRQIYGNPRMWRKLFERGETVG